MKKHKANPPGWIGPTSYQEVMALRSAYNAGVRNHETRQACSLYINYRRQVRKQENGL